MERDYVRMMCTPKQYLEMLAAEVAAMALTIPLPLHAAKPYYVSEKC